MLPRRVVLVGLGVSSALVVLSGCTQERELVVHFKPSATTAERVAALHACSQASSKASPEPVPSPSTYGQLTPPDVRFRIDSANDSDIADLERCLAQQPGVSGFEDTAGLTS